MVIYPAFQTTRGLKYSQVVDKWHSRVSTDFGHPVIFLITVHNSTLLFTAIVQGIGIYLGTPAAL